MNVQIGTINAEGLMHFGNLYAEDLRTGIQYIRLANTMAYEAGSDTLYALRHVNHPDFVITTDAAGKIRTFTA